ncbi:MAG: hypothetical protein ACRCU3_04335 [Eubacteriaceae bacterium]
MEFLNENEIELLDFFRRIDDRRQIIVIGYLEDKVKNLAFDEYLENVVISKGEQKSNIINMEVVRKDRKRKS